MPPPEGELASVLARHTPTHRRPGYTFPTTLRDCYGRGVFNPGSSFNRQLGLQTAAVLVLLFTHSADGETHVLLTERAAKMRSHGGQVALPGGKAEAEDGGDDCTTALREADEEVGLDTASSIPLCELDRLISGEGLLTTPVVALLDDDRADKDTPDWLHHRLVPCGDEVAAIVSMPLRLFLEDGPEHTFKDVLIGGADTSGPPRSMRLHYFTHSDCTTGRAFTVWGFTAAILVEAARVAFGRKEGFDMDPLPSDETTIRLPDPAAARLRRPAGAAAKL